MIRIKNNSMNDKVFLGGTCNESTWRDELIPLINIDYFNPVVNDWTPECQIEEERQKDNLCNIHLYVITPRMTGVFSIAEVVESAINKGANCIYCYLNNDGDLKFSRSQLKSLDAVGKLISKYGAKWAKSLDEVVDLLNNREKQSV